MCFVSVQFRSETEVSHDQFGSHVFYLSALFIACRVGLPLCIAMTS